MKPQERSHLSAPSVVPAGYNGRDPAAVMADSLALMALEDDRLNITAATFADSAGDEIEQRTFASLPLAGQPVAIKDTFALPWWAPRDGTGIAFDQPGAGASDLYCRVRDAGGVVLYATNMHQIGFGTTGHVSADGPCRNPWDPIRCAGGSSGGSAVAVSVGAVALAVGTDAAGSVRIPASYCGVVGLKPTWGTIGHAGTSSPSSLMAVGLFTRDTADLRHAAEAILRQHLPGVRRPITVGIPEVMWADLVPSVEEVCRAACDSLVRAGCDVVDVDLDVDPLQVAHSVRTALALERRERLSPAWRREVLPVLHPTIQQALEAAESLDESDLARVTRRRLSLARQLDQVFSTVDVLVWPTCPCPPPRIERPRAELPSGEASADLAVMGLAGLANLVGIPALSLPCGFDDAGLPIGLSLHSRWADERVLFDVGQLFEEITNLAHVRSPFADLSDAERETA